MKALIVSMVLFIYVQCFPAFSTTINYGSYIGGSRLDFDPKVAMDSFGNVYIAGETLSPDFVQTLGGPSASDQHPRGFVIKLSASRQLVYSTTFGGGYEDIRGIEPDSDGNVYVAGTAYSSEFQTTSGAFDTTFDNSNGYSASSFLIKLDPSGNLLFSTFFGDSHVFLGGLGVDANGYPYIGGSTNSIYLPVTAGAYQATYAAAQWYPDTWAMDSFITKFRKDGSGLIYSTYLGPVADDRFGGFAVDAQGSAYLSGTSASLDYYHVNSFQPKNSCAAKWDIAQLGFAGSPYDLFVAKLNPTGSGITYSTYIGSCAIWGSDGSYLYNPFGGEEVERDMRLDSSGNFYISGFTNAGYFGYTVPFPFTNQSFPGSNFVMKISASGKTIDFSASFPIDGKIAVDDSGKVYLAGEADSWQNLPVKNPIFDFARKDHESYPYLAKFDPTLTGPDALLYSSYIGSNGGSGVLQALATGSNGELWIAGNTDSQNFPTTGDALIPHWLTPDLFKADFQEPVDISSWPISGSGTWTTRIEDWVLAGVTSRSTSIFTPAQSCNDCTISASVDWDGTGKTRFYGWRKDSKNYVELELSSSNKLTIKHKAGGTIVAKKTLDWAPQDFELYANGKHIELWSQWEKLLEFDSSQAVSATGGVVIQAKNMKRGQTFESYTQEITVTQHRKDPISLFVYELQ